MIFSKKIYNLQPYEETCGLLEEISVEADFLIAKIGKIQLFLPLELKPSLLQHINQRIAVMRTDIPTKEYLVRTFSDQNDATRSQNDEENQIQIKSDNSNYLINYKGGEYNGKLAR